ncbi:MAG: hypothetical protein ACK41V_19590 [Acidovorax sp.]|uniref:hypothetical protein n=1 Tax=Acidovorax sp. TaxID=1872122 RepID=UPI00391A71A3
MSFNIEDKAVHLITAVLTALVGLCIVIWRPELLKDATTSIGTIGSFATAYGVFFAIIELRRAQKASEMATDEARKVFNAVTGLVTAREIAECQTTIYVAICSLEEGRAISSTVLHQIVKLYSQVFYAQLSEDASPHRKARSTIEAYSYNPNVSTSSSSKRTKQALLSIAGQLAELQGSTKNFTEKSR